MNPAWLELLEEVAHDVLRTTAFAFPEPLAPDEVLPPDGAALLASIHFQGASGGEISLAIGRQLGASLCSDILSEDGDDLTDGQIEDTCKELLNMICGQWLTAAHGALPVFTLSAPTARAARARRMDAAGSRQSRVGLTIDDQPLLIAMTAG